MYVSITTALRTALRIGLLVILVVACVVAFIAGTDLLGSGVSLWAHAGPVLPCPALLHPYIGPAEILPGPTCSSQVLAAIHQRNIARWHIAAGLPLLVLSFAMAMRRVRSVRKAQAFAKMTLGSKLPRRATV